jgi:hypothetical protein
MDLLIGKRRKDQDKSMKNEDYLSAHMGMLKG